MMKKYTEADTGKRIVEVYDLSFISDRDHPYGWLKRHFLHFRLKFALWRADRIYAKDTTIGVDLVRYYFVPKEKIVVNTNLKSADQKS
jgi:hypothetical protein